MTTTTNAIDSDPEFFHGLTGWGESSSWQVRGSEVIVHPLPPRHPKDAGEVSLTLNDARRLRDLLNVATDRGFL